MKDFTYAGLVSLLVRVIADYDPTLINGTAVADPMISAVVDAERKQTLVQQVMDLHGPGLLLSVGQHLNLADETPALTVLTNSASPTVLAEKFMRLECYHHSAHRTLIENHPGSWVCSRYSKGSLPTDGENYLIAGLLLGLVMAIGCRGGRLEIDGRTFAPGSLNDAILGPGIETAHFRVLWELSAAVDERRPPSRLRQHKMRLSDRLAALFETDIGRTWKSAEAARLLALSERSMQRHLTVEKRSYSSILRRVRIKAATKFLTKTSTGLAEIGYCCGYADQAHFQRDFLRTANVTPRRFRMINRESAVQNKFE